MNTTQNGALAEEKAQAFLKQKGYRIVRCNYRKPCGEIDIIAQDKDVIVFIEVKTRTSEEFGLPCQAVDKRKQEKY